MIQSNFVRFAAFCGLCVFALAGVAQAQTQTFNVSSDWATSFPTSTSVLSAASFTWGAGSAWSAGSMSWNWTNGPIYTSGTGDNHATQGSGNIQNLTTYYTPNTVGYETSGSSSTVTDIGTYTYTVPFQTYQFTPGGTINMAVGVTTTEMLANAQFAYAGEKITLPAGWTSNGASSGTIQGIGHAENIVSTSSYGFTTTAFNLQSHFSDGESGNTVQDGVPGVFYDYATTGNINSNDPMFNGASSHVNNTIDLEPSFGPTYVAWTAPASGNATINMSAWDIGYYSNTNDGVPNLYVITTGPSGGPTNPLMYVSDEANVGNGNQVGGRATPWDSANNYGTSVAGATLGFVAPLSEFPASEDFQNGINWTATISVTAGQVLYFVADASHTNGGAHSFEGSQDPVAMSIVVTTPEPTSLVLLSLGGIGLCAAAWKRRRAA